MPRDINEEDAEVLEEDAEVLEEDAEVLEEDADGLEEDVEHGEDSDAVDAEEMLSPITIRELLTVDEMADRDPSFIGMDDNQVINYAHDLFHSIGKAHGIAKLWRRIVNDRVPPAIPDGLTPMMDVDRMSESTMPPSWVTASALANALPTVQQRMSELERIAFPYVIQTSQHSGPTLAELGPREIHRSYQDSLRITNADIRISPHARIPMMGVRAPNMHPRRFTIAESQSWHAHTRAYEFERRQKVIEDVINAAVAASGADAPFTLSDWQRALSAKALDWDKLVVVEMRIIANHLIQYANSNVTNNKARVRASLVDVKPLPDAMNVGAISPYVAFEAFVKPAAERVREKLLRQLQSLDASSRVVVVDFGAFKTHDIATLFEDTTSDAGALDKLIVDLRELHVQRERQDAKAFLEAAIELLNMEDINKVHQAHERFAWTQFSANHVVLHANANFPPFADLKEAEAGADIQGYTGSLAQNIMAAVSTDVNTDDSTKANTDEMDWTALLQEDDHGSIASTSLPLRASTSQSQEGTSELFNLLNPLLLAMAEGTCLPLPIDAIKLSITSVKWESTSSMLAELMPEGLHDLSISQLEALIQDPTVIDSYFSKDTQALTKRALMDVRVRFASAVNEALTRAFATWVVTLQETFLDRRLLDYKVPSHLVTCGHLWGYHGPPMTRTKGRGVVMFLLCVFQQTAPTDMATSYLEHGIENTAAAIGASAELIFPGRVASLIRGFADLQPVFQKQREDLKKEQAQIKRFLEGDGTVNRFLAGLLQLPQIMARSSETFVRRRQRTGCCEQTLDEGYRAYADWGNSRTLKTLQKQMSAWGLTDLHMQCAITGLWRVGNPEGAPTTDVTMNMGCTQTMMEKVKEELVVPRLSFDDVLKTWRQWLPIEIMSSGADISKYVLLRLEALSVATRHPKAVASTWFASLQSLRYEALVAMAHVVARSQSLHSETCEPLKALRQLRTSMFEDADEQRVLDLVRALILSWIQVRDRALATAAAVILNAASARTPSAITLQNKISELRERQKANLLNRLNNTDDNMRQLMTSMNRIGIINIRDDAKVSLNAADNVIIGSGGMDVDEDGDYMDNATEDAPDMAPWRGENEDGDEDVL